MCATVDNNKIILDIDNSRMTGDDFRMKWVLLYVIQTFILIFSPFPHILLKQEILQRGIIRSFKLGQMAFLWVLTNAQYYYILKIHWMTTV